MKVKYIIFFICSLTTHILYAQKVEVIEPAVLECEYYKRVVTDTLDRKNDYKAEPARLRIGQNSSMFYSPRELRWDSLGTDRKKKEP